MSSKGTQGRGKNQKKARNQGQYNQGKSAINMADSDKTVGNLGTTKEEEQQEQQQQQQQYQAMVASSMAEKLREENARLHEELQRERDIGRTLVHQLESMQLQLERAEQNITTLRTQLVELQTTSQEARKGEGRTGSATNLSAWDDYDQPVFQNDTTKQQQEQQQEHKQVAVQGMTPPPPPPSSFQQMLQQQQQQHQQHQQVPPSQWSDVVRNTSINTTTTTVGSRQSMDHSYHRKAAIDDKYNWSVYVKGIPFHMTTEEIYEYFVSRGVVDLVGMRLPKFDDSPHRLKGYGFLFLNSYKSFQVALSLSGQNIGSRYLEVFPNEHKHMVMQRNDIIDSTTGGGGDISGGGSGAVQEEDEAMRASGDIGSTSEQRRGSDEYDRAVVHQHHYGQQQQQQQQQHLQHQYPTQQYHMQYTQQHHTQYSHQQLQHQQQQQLQLGYHNMQQMPTQYGYVASYPQSSGGMVATVMPMQQYSHTGRVPYYNTGRNYADTELVPPSVVAAATTAATPAARPTRPNELPQQLLQCEPDVVVEVEGRDVELIKRDSSGIKKQDDVVSHVEKIEQVKHPEAAANVSASDEDQKEATLDWVCLMGTPYDATVEQVEDFFSSNGISDMVEVLLPAHADGRSKGYIYARFSSEASYDKVLQSLNGKTFGKRWVEIKPADTGSPEAERSSQPSPSRTLFVANLNFSVTKETLAEQLAEAYWAASGDGDLELDDIRVIRNNRRNGSFAYVDFKRLEDAERVYQRARRAGIPLDGRWLRVDFEEHGGRTKAKLILKKGDS